MDLKITEVKSKGDYPEEALWLRVLADCDLARYIIADRTYDDAGESNLHRHTYWFPAVRAKAGDRVVLYTRAGSNGSGRTAGGQPLHRFFWNLEQAVWNDDGDGATLVQIADLASFSVRPA